MESSEKIKPNRPKKRDESAKGSKKVISKRQKSKSSKIPPTGKEKRSPKLEQYSVDSGSPNSPKDKSLKISPTGKKRLPLKEEQRGVGPKSQKGKSAIIPPTGKERQPSKEEQHSIDKDAKPDERPQRVRRRKIPFKDMTLEAKIQSLKEYININKTYRVYVRGFLLSTTNEQLKKHFEEAGCKVKDVRVVHCRETGKPKGYGFVDFMECISFKKAYSLHESELEGKTIKVEWTTNQPTDIYGNKKAERRSRIRAINERYITVTIAKAARAAKASSNKSTAPTATKKKDMFRLDIKRRIARYERQSSS